MEESFKAISEAEEEGALVQDVYKYISGRQYLPHCTDLRKRAI